MQEQDGLTSAEHELERALRSLSPANARLDPIAAAFDAGRKVRQRQVRAWTSACVVLLVIQCASIFCMRGAGVATSPRGIEQASISRQMQPASAPTHSMPTLMFLQDAVEKRGLDGLPTTDLPEARPINAKDQI